MKLYLLSTVLLSGFQSSMGALNPLSKRVPDQFVGSGGYSKRSCLQDWANFFGYGESSKFLTLL